MWGHRLSRSGRCSTGESRRKSSFPVLSLPYVSSFLVLSQPYERSQACPCSTLTRYYSMDPPIYPHLVRVGSTSKDKRRRRIKASSNRAAAGFKEEDPLSDAPVDIDMNIVRKKMGECICRHYIISTQHCCGNRVTLLPAAPGDEEEHCE